MLGSYVYGQHKMSGEQINKMRDQHRHARKWKDTVNPGMS